MFPDQAAVQMPSQRKRDSQMANVEPIVKFSYARSKAMYERALHTIPGGVSSDVRLEAGPFPLFFEGASGSHIRDVDGHDYIDYVLGMGPAILGHSPAPVIEAVAATLYQGQVFAGQHEGEYELAERLVRLIPSCEMVRLGSSGSDMVHLAMRLARAATGRRLIAKLEGHYHGWLDGSFISVHPPLADAGDARQPRRHVASAGQSPGAAKDVTVLPWNDLESVEAAFAAHGKEIAGIVLEPILCNSSVIVPSDDYLAGLRQLCDRAGAVLIFDEVITGFRVGLHGAQGRLGVTPDLTVLGKALGGGFQIAACVGKRSIMELVGRRVIHAGTNNGNVLAVAAALATLKELERDGGSPLEAMEARGKDLCAWIAADAKGKGIDLLAQGVGGVFSTLLGVSTVKDYRDYCRVDGHAQLRLHRLLQEHGIRIMARGTWMMSTAHTEHDLEVTRDSVSRAFDQLARA